MSVPAAARRAPSPATSNTRMTTLNRRARRRESLARERKANVDIDVSAWRGAVAAAISARDETLPPRVDASPRSDREDVRLIARR